MKTPWHSRPIPVEPDPQWPGKSLNGRYIGIGVECPGRDADLVAGPAELVVHCPNCRRDMRYKLFCKTCSKGAERCECATGSQWEAAVL